MFKRSWIVPTLTKRNHKLTLAWLVYNARLLTRLSTTLSSLPFDTRHLWTGLLLTGDALRLQKPHSVNRSPSIVVRPKVMRGTRFASSKTVVKGWSKLSPVVTALPDRVLQIFQATFQFTNSLYPRDFNPHPAFRLLFMRDRRSGPSIISFDYYFKRWKHTYLLLFNLFFTHNALPTFGSRVFKTEILALNWSFNLFTYKLFKHASPFFIFEDESYGLAPTLVLKRWRRSALNYLFLLELKIFKKFQHLFKTLNFIIIGLVPMNMNPWLVSYPIPAFSDSRFIQYYFLKLITFVRQNASRLRFQQRHNVWLTTLR